MRILIEFISRFRDYFAFVFLVIISLSLISVSDVSKIGGFRALIVSSLGSIQEKFGWIPDISAVKSESKAIRELNLYLSNELMQSRKALSENKRLRDLLELKTNYKDRVISAEVTGLSVVELRNYATINKGSLQGVAEGMAVRTDAGLCGIILAVAENYALIELIKNRNMQVAVKLQTAETNGILVWEGDDNFLVKNIPRTYPIEMGDVVVTSNYSSRFPEDVPVGEISEVNYETNSLFYDLKVRTYAGFSSLQQVFVLTETQDPERIELIRDMEKRLLARKVR